MTNRLVCVLALFLNLVPATAEEMPHVTGKSLTDKDVDFPGACLGAVCILVVGFSHGSQSQARGWAERLNREIGNNAHVAIYSIAVLEDAPRLMRGMAVHGIKSGTPQAQRAHFIIVYSNEAELKRAAGFQRADDAYVLLIDSKGRIEWKTNGEVNDSAMADLNKRISSMPGK